MQITVNWKPEVSDQFPNLAVCVGLAKGVCIQQDNQQLRQLKKTVYEEVINRHEIDRLKEDPTVRAYRDFYWTLNIDPTKTRPSGEALLRRVLHGEELPNVSTAVDAYNLASMKTIIPISGFDLDQLAPPFHVRFAKENETFTGIGMKAPIALKKQHASTGRRKTSPMHLSLPRLRRNKDNIENSKRRADRVRRAKNNVGTGP